ncbi:MAG: guanylate kinase [Oscillospiraceae bacterium]|nr:guanylate kinase [Oscillospiraceae bacterium]
MHHLFYLMGKSASGKDSLYHILSEQLPLLPVVLYTTRPQRDHEQGGRDYHFIGQEALAAMRAAGELIEERTYHTVAGDWTYCTAKGSVPLEQGDCLGIGTLESFERLRDYLGAEAVIPLYIEVEDGLRLQRALDRERAQEKPNYAELCRRFLTDTADFSEEKLAHAGIVRRFRNLELKACAAELTAFITAHTAPAEN